MAKQTSKKKKVVAPPTAAQQKAFSKKFRDKEEWQTCCESPAFMQAVQTDLKKAEIIAVKILSELWNWHDDCPYDL